MKKFFKNNQEFVCNNCGQLVERHKSSSRDHCNHCLYSIHIDINPGDRLNECKGFLVPKGLKISNGKTKIVYQCEKCKEMRSCVVAQDDNKEVLVELSKKVWVGNY